MNTSYNEIVNIPSIGEKENPISLNDILTKANNEHLTPAKNNAERVMFLGIDVQQSFMENGELGVPGAHGDVERMTKFIYNNIDKISNIAVSIDTHTPHQIFHPCWWVDENGNNPAPNTPITLADLDAGKWRAVISPRTSREYVEHLEKKDNENRCKLVEATTRLFQQFLPRMRKQPDVVNSSLYILNKAGNLVYSDLNKKYNYDESKAENDFENLYGFKL